MEALTEPIRGDVTKIVAETSKLVDVNSPLYKETLRKEEDYMQKMFETFGPKEAPRSPQDEFAPSLSVEDNTTLEDLKPALSEVFKSGVEYWSSFIKLSKFSPPAESQLALHERALGFLNGERNDTRSFKEVVTQMAEITKVYSEDQRKDRVDSLYAKKTKDTPLWLGKLAYTKIGVLWNWGAREICNYQEDFSKHAMRVKDVALRNIS
jgi:hypothetical protein